MAGYDEETAVLTPEEQAALAAQAIEAAPEYGLYGYFTSGATETAVASSTGHAVSQEMTDASVLAFHAHPFVRLCVTKIVRNIHDFL